MILGGLRLVTPPNSDKYAQESSRQFDEAYGEWVSEWINELIDAFIFFLNYMKSGAEEIKGSLTIWINAGLRSKMRLNFEGQTSFVNLIVLTAQHVPTILFFYHYNPPFFILLFTITNTYRTLTSTWCDIT